ncbi:MAG: hypothetical protein O7G86_13925 [Gammaproteobacteria bacterium]|nr:hypothetical protein [Gammaproteobacteria bacterium]
MSYRKYIGILMAATSFVGSAAADPLLNANSASAEELAGVSVLSESIASAITAGRPFATIGDLNMLLSKSMSGAETELLYRELFIPINLNAASREDILLIPGVGRRMAHEFEEYRPYSSMEQFRREIGKYVDEEEVARLEMYVAID